jgi:methyl-accepting chemotaxis protein
MLKLLRKARPLHDVDEAETAAQRSPGTVEPAGEAGILQAVASVSQQAGRMGREAAEVRGVLEDSAQEMSRRAELMATLVRQVSDVVDAQKAIGDTTQASMRAMGRAREAVEAVAGEVAGIVDTLRQVAQAAGQITQIAMQTRLVAFNASVEAKRAGEAGRGFGVVADAVRDLAGKVEASSKDIMGTVSDLDGRVEALSREIRRQDHGIHKGGFHQALADLEGGVGGISAAAQRSRTICDTLAGQMNTLQADMHGSRKVLDSAFKRSEAFLGTSESLIELLACCGVETEDTPYIRAAQDTAQRVGEVLEAAVRNGDITLDDLFDERYEPIPGTHPQQHLTRFAALTDRLLPPIQEPLLTAMPKVVFHMCCDRNGYVATHNQKYCHPQRGDPAWDTAHSRYRRIFNDRTGLAAGRNTRPFLLQTYRRDMGGGRYVLLKEASAPIVVHGRHWGGVRLAFEF